VRIRSGVLVRRRASMVMVCIRRRRDMKHPGGNTERCQQQEYTIGCTQAQGAQAAPISVSRAAVSPRSATESVQFWQGMTYHNAPLLRRIIHKYVTPSYHGILHTARKIMRFRLYRSGCISPPGTRRAQDFTMVFLLYGSGPWVLRRDARSLAHRTSRCMYATTAHLRLHLISLCF
jgi:hypothetical protein